MQTARVAIIGSGNIGTDLLLKARKSVKLKVTHMVGRRQDSPGLARARSLGVATGFGGLEDLELIAPNIDVIFDATSASDHLVLNESLGHSGKLIINLTPAQVGEFFIPGVTHTSGIEPGTNLNMVTCGGQTSIPVIKAVLDGLKPGTISYVELASTLASKSAGPATRRNLDEYVDNTSNAISTICGVPAKVMLALNPAVPEPVMRSSVYLASTAPASIILEPLAEIIEGVNQRVRDYCPGFTIQDEALVLEEHVIKLQIEVTSSSESFPIFAGNLDIINTAAIRAAENFVAGFEG